MTHCAHAPDHGVSSGRDLQVGCRELQQAVLNLAGYMQQRFAVRRADRVVVLMHNGPQLAIACLAALRCDAVAIALDAQSTTEQIDTQLGDGGARVVIAMQDSLQRVEPLLASRRIAACIVGASSEVPINCEDALRARAPVHVIDELGMTAPTHHFADALAAGIAPVSGPGGAWFAANGAGSEAP